MSAFVLHGVPSSSLRKGVLHELINRQGVMLLHSCKLCICVVGPTRDTWANVPSAASCALLPKGGTTACYLQPAASLWQSISCATVCIQSCSPLHV